MTITDSSTEVKTFQTHTAIVCQDEIIQGRSTVFFEACGIFIRFL